MQIHLVHMISCILFSEDGFRGPSSNFFLLVLAFNASSLIDKFEYKAVHLIKENGRCVLI